MRRWVVERALIPAVRLLEQPGEKLWLGIALATVLAIVFAPGVTPTWGSPTGGLSAKAPGSYHPAPNAAPFATTQDSVKKPNPHPANRPLDTARLPEATGPAIQDEFGVIH